MKNELKLRLKIQEQQMTLWEITKQADNYIMFRASVTSGKKNPDGTWDNINQGFTCFANGEAMKKISDNFTQRARIKVSGSITMLPEKRPAVGRNGSEYQETIFSNATLNVDNVEFIEGENFASNSEKNDAQYSAIDDDIPF
jgi:hypothetical protein